MSLIAVPWGLYGVAVDIFFVGGTWGCHGAREHMPWIAARAFLCALCLAIFVCSCIHRIVVLQECRVLIAMQSCCYTIRQLVPTTFISRYLETWRAAWVVRAERMWMAIFQSTA